MSGGDRRNDRIDVEWLAMRAGLKPANRITVSPDHAEQVTARLHRDGMTVERGARPIEFPGRPPSLILYASPDPARARALVDVEAPLLPPDGARLRIDDAVPLHTRLGALLGFPACCVDEFCVRLRRGITRRLRGGDAHEDFVAAECAADASQRFLGVLSDLVPDRHVRIVTFYPCRYDCTAAAEYATAVLDAAVKFAPAAAATLRAALGGAHSISTNGSRGRAEELSGDVLTVEFEAA